MEYPAHLHDLHNEFPLAPEMRKATNDMLSEYQYEQKKKFGTDNCGMEEKLMCTLYDKKEYVLNIWCVVV